MAELNVGQQCNGGKKTWVASPPRSSRAAPHLCFSHFTRLSRISPDPRADEKQREGKKKKPG